MGVPTFSEDFDVDDNDNDDDSISISRVNLWGRPPSKLSRHSTCNVSEVVFCKEQLCGESGRPVNYFFFFYDLFFNLQLFYVFLCFVKKKKKKCYWLEIRKSFINDQRRTRMKKKKKKIEFRLEKDSHCISKQTLLLSFGFVYSKDGFKVLFKSTSTRIPLSIKAETKRIRRKRERIHDV